MAEEATVASSEDTQPQEDTDNAAREAEEAKRREEEELQRKAEEEAIRKAAAEEEARRKQDAEERAKREEEKKKALEEKFDSFDVIGDFVDKENQELARRRRQEAQETRPSSTLPFMSDSGQGKEKSELGRELWEAASQASFPQTLTL